GIDPILDPPTGDVARIRAHRDRGDPRAHKMLPRFEEAALAGLAERVGEVEPEVELVPLDRPLLVVGASGAQPVQLETAIARQAAVCEPSDACRLRHGAVTMAICDDTEDRPGPRAHRYVRSGRKSAASRAASRSPSKRSRTVSLAARASRRASE